ncbi:STAS domain-containing protein [Solirubrobacter phytolaccae]|uniref:Anti-sigma factor antagonist n=1 Tax=Solirubrobacter phytolaccae TaxID=1404360 RepID=A0A9X3N8I6_9ACTN|nr:STAS domain-containing protein [Solirubrobacter phytolaccae]MDA0180217.1 STAS domain-containing protein [Solirubrobacter phytolaccae]
MEAGPDFTVTRRRVGDAIVVVPAGEIDLATVDRVGREVEEAHADSECEIVLDLRDIRFIDSTGIRLVVQLARDLNGRFAVVRGGGEVARVFDLVGLDGRVRMLDTPPEG